MDERTIMAAMAVERKQYTALTEVMELTEELSQALQRQDQVSVQMFLSMRQESINRLREYRSLLERQCAVLSPEEGKTLRQLLSGEGGDTSQAGKSLERLVGQNRNLLEKILHADIWISKQLGGKKSFYAQRETRNRDGKQT